MIATRTGLAWDAATDVAAQTANAAAATVSTAAVFQLRSLSLLTGGALLPLVFRKSRDSRAVRTQLSSRTIKQLVDWWSYFVDSTAGAGVVSPPLGRRRTSKSLPHSPMSPSGETTTMAKKMIPI